MPECFGCYSDEFTVKSEIGGENCTRLCFTFTVERSLFYSLTNIEEFGGIYMPTNDTRGRDIFLDSPVVFDWKWNETEKDIFTVKTTGDIPNALKADKFYESGNGVYYKLFLEISEEEYDRYYTMRGYIKYKGENGKEHIIYTAQKNTSLYRTAVDAVKTAERSKKEKIRRIIDSIEIISKKAMLADEAQKKINICGYQNCEDTNPNHKIYKYKNLFIREISVSSGKKLSLPIKIAVFTDPHFNHMDVRDINMGRQTTFSTYRGRSWNRNGITTVYCDDSIQYSKYFDMTVVLGDVMDYFSFGSAEVMKRMLIDKYVSGKLLMALGNHEQIEILTPDISGLTCLVSDEERDRLLKEYWPNDIYYDSKILSDSDGNEGVMLVVMMTGWDKFYESQKIGLSADIKTAREKGIPILIFCHNPICTKNPNESEYFFTYDEDKFGTREQHIKTVDMANRFAGKADSDEITKKVYNLIVTSYDVIKGVFHGHEHGNMYTEIMAQDKCGNFIREGEKYIVIPQYGLHAIAEMGGAIFNISVL